MVTNSCTLKSPAELKINDAGWEVGAGDVFTSRDSELGHILGTEIFENSPDDSNAKPLRQPTM